MDISQEGRLGKDLIIGGGEGRIGFGADVILKVGNKEISRGMLAMAWEVGWKWVGAIEDLRAWLWEGFRRLFAEVFNFLLD